MPVLQVNSRSIDQKSGEICTGQADLQPISFRSDRLLVIAHNFHIERINLRMQIAELKTMFRRRERAILHRLDIFGDGGRDALGTGQKIPGEFRRFAGVNSQQVV